MKFKVIINTFKRPLRAIAVAETLRAMKSGKHDVQFTIAYDQEDLNTGLFFQDLDWLDDHEDIGFDCQPRPDSLQDVWNRNLHGDADFFLPMPDDGFCAAPSWDEAIVKMAAKYPDPRMVVMAWNDQANPGQLTVPIVSNGWLQLLGDTPLMDPRFPFWFSDTAIAETWSFITGAGVPIPDYLLLAGQPGEPNPIMRDVDLWWDLYAATRVERLELAEKIARKVGIETGIDDIQNVVSQWCQRDEDGRREAHKIVDQLVKTGKQKPETPQYLRAKAAAVAYLEQFNLKVDAAKEAEHATIN
jgi:hypothetical protein